MIGDTLVQLNTSFPTTLGVVSLGFARYDTGAITLNTSGGTSMRVHAQEDMMAMASGGKVFGEGCTVGASVKMLQSRVFEEFSTRAVAVDVGMQVRVLSHGKAALLLQNAGSHLQYFEGALSLPATLCLGFGYAFPNPAGMKGTLVSTVETSFADTAHDVVLRGGVEYRWADSFALRGGVNSATAGNDVGLSCGFAASFGKLRIDYAITLSQIYYQPQSFSLTVTF